MIFETTYSDKEVTRSINNIVGKPFTFFQSLKMNGVGSKRMIIEYVSPNFRTYLNTVSDLNYANIELRPLGVLVRINKGLRNFTWTIPYYHLVIYKTDGSSIHAQGKFIHFKNNKTFKENKNFFKKMMDQKIRFDDQYNFQDTIKTNPIRNNRIVKS